jgi:hypothetical protein
VETDRFLTIRLFFCQRSGTLPTAHQPTTRPTADRIRISLAKNRALVSITFLTQAPRRIFCTATKRAVKLNEAMADRSDRTWRLAAAAAEAGNVTELIAAVRHESTPLKSEEHGHPEHQWA